jgi:hypothetical protein
LCGTSLGTTIVLTVPTVAYIAAAVVGTGDKVDFMRSKEYTIMIQNKVNIMTRRKQKTRIRLPGPSSTAADRVVWLLSEVWDGNRSKMAEAVGVTHSVLTKIAAKQQNPGKRLLDAIAAHRKVNPVWLATGEGEPLLAERESGTSEGWPIRISREMLPGPINEHLELLTDESFPVAGAHYRPTRYWLYILGNNPICRSNRTSIEVGDLLLIETDLAHWRDPEIVDNHFCIVRTKGTLAPQLALLTWFPGEPGDPARLTAEYFPENKAGTAKLIERTIIDKYPSGRVEVRSKKFGASKGKPGRLEGISLSDIVGACTLVVRQF